MARTRPQPLIAAHAAGADLGQAVRQATNWTATSMFAGFVVLTLFITKWAAAKTKSAADFYTAGVGIELTIGLVCELNDRLLARLWEMLAPPEWIRDSCLVVMGSEGRCEQILKTDQDNGLLPEQSALAAAAVGDEADDWSLVL